MWWIPVRERKRNGYYRRETESLLPPQMKWLCGWMYMWVQAARSCEWEVGTEWEEKRCFSEMISTKACWKAVTLSWLFFVFLHLYKCIEVADGWWIREFLCLPTIICLFVCEGHYLFFLISVMQSPHVVPVVIRLDRNLREKSEYRKKTAHYVQSVWKDKAFLDWFVHIFM